MKKLNRKGFTLVELLAVIVILAIVVGVSIPSVTSIINGAKTSAMKTALESAVDYIADQYDIYNIDTTATTGLVGKLYDESGDWVTLTDDDKEELGFKLTNVEIVSARLIHDGDNNTAKICVRIEKIKTDSEYYNTNSWKPDGSPKDDNYLVGNKSNACAE